MAKRWTVGALGAVLALCCATASHSQPNNDSAAKIVAFSPEKTQALGRAMYLQDQAAWRATDLMFAAKPDMTGMIGWVATPYEGGQRVRFIKGPPEHPNAAYEVIFKASVTPSFAAANDPALTADELAQMQAFRTAAQSGVRYCGSRPPNHIELRDPDTGEWLVWLLTPSTNEGIAMGGHTRVTVSADGSTVVRKEEMSRSCLMMKQETPSKGAEPAMMFVTQLVADRPLETHVFTALTNDVPIGVATPDSTLGIVDGETITNKGSIDKLGKKQR